MTQLVVPDGHFTIFCAGRDQAQVVTKFDDGDICIVATFDMSQLLSLALIGLVVDEVALLVSINNLVHLLFPDENHIYYVSLNLLARLHVLVLLRLVKSIIIIRSSLL